MAAAAEEITRLLLRWSGGDTEAFDQLLPIIIPELRRIARRYMGRENSQHTLQTSALINEAYLRLVDQKGVDWKDRSHFLAVSAQIMRHILVDHARRHLYAKRGGGAEHIALDESVTVKHERATEFVMLDQALQTLGTFDERKLRIVELRFFGGLTVEETAQVMDLSPITIKREWRSARAWLLRELDRSIS